MMLNVFFHHQAYLLRIGIRFQTFLNSFGYTPTGCTVVLYHLDSSIICHSSFQKNTSIVIITKTWFGHVLFGIYLTLCIMEPPLSYLGRLISALIPILCFARFQNILDFMPFQFRLIGTYQIKAIYNLLTSFFWDTKKLWETSGSLWNFRSTQPVS